MKNNSEKESVLIFRKSILPYSETFIAEQGINLSKFIPCFCGFEYVNSGLFLLDQQEKIVLSDYVKSLTASKLLYRYGLNGCKKWLESIRQKKPSLVHAHFINDGVDAMRLARALSIPLVVTVHGHDITKNDISFFGKRNMHKLFMEADKFIAVSEYIKSVLIEKGCDERKIVTHYIGIDADRFHADKFESKVPTILFVGRLVEKKGCIYLLQAIRRINNPLIKVYVAGDGPLKRELEEYAMKYKLNVEFLGRKKPDDLRKLLQSSWMLCVPSITSRNGDAEGLGMVFLESQAMKTPVISFSSGGVVEAVEHGKSGLLSSEENIEDLAANIQLMIDDSELRREFGEYGRKRVLDKFNIKRQCECLEGIYSTLL